MVRDEAKLPSSPNLRVTRGGPGDADAAKRSLESLAFAGDALITDTAAFCRLLSANK
jgi:hypothetical protein